MSHARASSNEANGPNFFKAAIVRPRRRHATPPRTSAKSSSGETTAEAGAAAVFTRLVDAEIPHLHSTHVPIHLYETTIDVAGHPVKLVLPVSATA